MAKGSMQIGVVLQDETRQPVTVAAVIEQIIRPSWKKECYGVQDSHVIEHCLQYT